MGYLKVCVKEEEMKRVGWREGKRGGESDAFLGQLTYHLCSILEACRSCTCRGESTHLLKTFVLQGNFAL